MKKLLILALPLLILFVGFAKAQCVTPYENMEITSDTVFCQGTYYLNDSDKNSSIIVTGSNLVLDCNNSVIIGSFIQDSIGIRVTGNNVTVKNCRAEGYWYAIVLEGDPNYLDNATVKDGFFTIVTGRGNYYLTNIKCLGNYTDTCIHEGDIAAYVYLENISVKAEFDVPWGIFFTRLSSGDFKNIYFYYENYTHALEGRVAGLGLANVSNVNVENIVTENLTFPLVIDYCWGGEPPECGENHNVSIKNVNIVNSREGLQIHTLLGGSIIGVNVSESNFGIYAENSTLLYIESCNIKNINDKGIYLKFDKGSTIENTSILSGGETGIRIEDSSGTKVFNCTVKGFTFGTWTCCGPSHNLTFAGNYFEDSFIGIGIGEGNTNLNISNNTIVDCSNGIQLWGTNVGIWSAKILNNTIKSSGSGIGFFDAYNIEVKGNRFESVNSIFKLALNVSNVTSCQNSLVDYNYTYRIFLFQSRNLNLENVMRPDSDSCTPYLSLSVQPTSIDYGTLGKFETKSENINVSVSTNILDTWIAVSKYIAGNFKFKVQKHDMDKVIFSCYDNPSSWNSVDCSQFEETLSYYEKPIPYSKLELLPLKDSLIEAYLELDTDDSPEGSYTGEVEIKFSNEVEDSANVSVAYEVSKYTPTISLTAYPAWEVDYGTQTNVTCQIVQGDSGAIVELYRNGSLVGSGTAVSDVVILGVGVWNYTCYYPETQNYTSYSATSYLTVNPISPTLRLTIYPSANVSYGTQTNVTCELVEGDPSGIVELYRDSSLVGSGKAVSDVSVLPVGNHTYVCKYPATQNYTYSELSTWVNVYSAPAPPTYKIVLPYGLGVVLSVVVILGAIVYIIRMFDLTDPKSLIKVGFLAVAMIVLVVVFVSMLG